MLTRGAAAITRLAEDPLTRKGFGAAGRERVEQQFSWGCKCQPVRGHAVRAELRQNGIHKESAGGKVCDMRREARGNYLAKKVIFGYGLDFKRRCNGAF